MNFILEGPDNAGKTTLANFLRDHVRCATYFHPGGKPDGFEAETRCMEQQLDKLIEHQSLILDRCTPVSQMVYNSAIMHDDDRMGMAQEFRKFAMFVYCRPSTDRLLRVQDLTWRDDETDEHKEKIITRQHEFVSRYDKVMALIPCITYDYDSPLCSAVPDMMVRALQDDQSAIAWFHKLINWR